jgi:hypothetical protein
MITPYSRKFKPAPRITNGDPLLHEIENCAQSAEFRDHFLANTSQIYIHAPFECMDPSHLNLYTAKAIAVMSDVKNKNAYILYTICSVGSPCVDKYRYCSFRVYVSEHHLVLSFYNFYHETYAIHLPDYFYSILSAELRKNTPTFSQSQDFRL